MDLLDPRLEAYLKGLNDHPHAVLHALEAWAETHDFPIVGPVVGRYLYQLTRIHKPMRIFELGSGFGYSAYWFAAALRDAGLDGEVVLTDLDPEQIEMARVRLGEAGLDSYCTFCVGDALELLEEDEGAVDLFFVDIEKEDYPRSIDLMLPRLNDEGLIVIDNMLWYGRPIEGHDDAPTRGVIEATRRLFEDERLLTTLLPLRDGVAVALKR